MPPLDDASAGGSSLPVRTFVPDDLRLIKGSPRRRREYLDSLAARCDPSTRRPCGGTRRPWPSGTPCCARPAGRSAGRRSSTPGRPCWPRPGLLVSRLAGRHARLVRRRLPADARRAHRRAGRDSPAGLPDERRRPGRSRPTGPAWPRSATPTGSGPTPTSGPHRDDLRLMRGGLDMRDCASQGEQRDGAAHPGARRVGATAARSGRSPCCCSTT